MFKHFVVLFIIGLLSIPQTAFGQLSVDLDSISVTASRITTSVSESGKSVSVLTQRDIEEMPITSVDELLRTLPGVNINARQGFGVQADVGVRGSTFSQVLFMLDNVPLNDPLTAHFNANIPVALSEIGQIELIRGPASASFGADAVGGVVHIKTRSYLERELEAGDQLISRASADVGLGQHNLRTGDVSIELQRNRWRFSSALLTVQSDGEELSNPGFEEGISDQETYNNFFEMTNFTSSFTYQFSDNLTFYTRAGIEDRDFNARYFYTRNIFDEAVEEISSRWGLASLTFDRDAYRSELSTSYRQVDDTYLFMPGTPANEHTTDQIYLNWSHQYEFLGAKSDDESQQRLNPDRYESIQLMVGGQYLGQQIESTDRGDHQTDMGGIYAVGTISWVNGWNITASSRLQFDEVAGTDFLPQLSASWNRGSVTLRGSAGQAIRVGDFTEKYVSSQIPNLEPERNIGNPNLLPERSFTIDGGIDWRPVNNLRLSQTVFYRSSENLIDYTLTNSNEIDNADNLQEDELYFYANNISDSEVVGVEFLSDWNHRFQRGINLGLQGGYTYIRTTNDEDDLSKYIANHPKHQVNGSVKLSGRWGSIHSDSKFYTRNEEAAELVGGDVPSSYFISNIKLQSAPGLMGGASVYMRVMNLTDTQYQEILGAPMPGRWVMGGLQWRL